MLVKLRGTEDCANPVSHHNTYLITFLLALCSAVGLWLTRSPLPADFDAINYVMGIEQFNLELHQPHPPGAPIFIALGKLLAMTGMSAVDALQGLSVLGGVLLVVAWYRLFLLMVTEEVALFAAISLALTPSLWLSATQPMSDTLAAAGVSITLWLVVLFWQQRRTSLVIFAALSAAFALGIRPQLGVFVVLLLMSASVAVRLPLKTALCAALVFAVANLAWLLPAVLIQAQLADGDLFAYFKLLASFGDEFSVASDSPMLSSKFELLQVWKRIVMHFGAMGYFGAGLGLWYPDELAQRLASFGTRLTPIFADLKEWSVAGSVLFCFFSVGVALSLRRAHKVVFKRKALLLLFFALLYAATVLMLVPPHTRFYLVLIPLLMVWPLIGFSRLKANRYWCIAFIAAQLASLGSVAMDSRRAPPPPMALAMQLAEYRKASDVSIHALLDSNGSRHVQWMLPEVHLHHHMPESTQSWMELLERGERVFSNTVTDSHFLGPQFELIEVGDYRRPLRVWMRHTGTTLYEIRPSDTAVSSKS